MGVAQTVVVAGKTPVPVTVAAFRKGPGRTDPPATKTPTRLPVQSSNKPSSRCERAKRRARVTAWVRFELQTRPEL